MNLAMMVNHWLVRAYGADADIAKAFRRCLHAEDNTVDMRDLQAFLRDPRIYSGNEFGTQHVLHVLRMRASRGDTAAVKRILGQEKGLKRHAIKEAIAHGRLNLTNILIQANEIDDPVDSLPPLILAAKAGQLEIVRSLIDRGAKKTLKPLCDPPFTPAQYAAFHGHFNILKLLLQPNAESESLQDWQRFAFDIFTFHSSRLTSEVLSYLCKREGPARGLIDVNIPNENGTTLLHIASKDSQRPERVAWLLDCGANPMARDAAGQTPLDVVRIAKHKVPLATTSIHDFLQRFEKYAPKLEVRRGVKMRSKPNSMKQEPLKRKRFEDNSWVLMSENNVRLPLASTRLNHGN